MTKVVLSQKADSGYDDVPGVRYHFPRTYLRAAQAAQGDGCLFYEPRRNGGRMVYWASARIDHVYPDPIRPEHFYAKLEGFLEFPEPVNFRRADEKFWESRLETEDGSPNAGLTQRSVREIPENDFDLILKAGYAPALTTPAREGVPSSDWGVAEDQLDFERPIFEQITNRPFRDRVFASQVRSAYDSRCAVTGLKIINGGGRAEMEAAHIKPVEARGPDSVRNGVALSRTVHWMFDRGLLSIDDDFKLLKALPLLPEGVERLFDPSGYVHVPDTGRDQPSRAFLRWHRENCFKG